MASSNRVISGQLHLTDADLTNHTLPTLIAKIDSAQKLAGLQRLLFRPSRNSTVNDKILSHCRKQGIEVYLWYKVLADNDIIADQNELTEDAWGKRGVGESGVWSPIFDSEETYLHGCPRNAKYNNLLLNRCRQALEHYDGLFADCIALPMNSLGLETLFTCFCPHCLKAEPRLAEWRKRVRSMREFAASASDADLEKWGSFQGVLAAFGLTDLFTFRKQSITELAAKYSALAKGMGKGFGLDVSPPALALFGGHDYGELGKLADWLKPRIYLRIFGPSSIILEFYCLTMGMIAWGKRYSIPGVLQYIERSTGVRMPTHIHALDNQFLPDQVAFAEIAKARQATACPIHPGLEFSLHPDYDTGLTEETVRTYLEKTKDSPGMVLTWNILYIPNSFLKLIGESNRRNGSTRV